MLSKSTPSKSISRRALLAGASVVAAASCTSVRPPRSKARVSITQVRAYSQELYATIRSVLQEHRLDVKGKRVLLKPNLVEFEENGVINTNPLVVHATYEAVRAAGAKEVLIGEGPGHRRTTLEMCERAGYFDLDRKFEDTFIDLNLDDVTEVALRDPVSKLRKLYLPNTALGVDLVISVAKLKTHHWVGATLSMKNLFGVVPGGVYGWPKNVLHWAGIDECIVDLYRTFPRHFCIVDGIDGMEGNGPIQGVRKHAGVIVAGNDMAAVDAACCRVMGIDPEKIAYLMRSNSFAAQASGVEHIGVSPASVRSDFALLPDWNHIRLPGHASASEPTKEQTTPRPS